MNKISIFIYSFLSACVVLLMFRIPSLFKKNKKSTQELSTVSQSASSSSVQQRVVVVMSEPLCPLFDQQTNIFSLPILQKKSNDMLQEFNELGTYFNIVDKDSIHHDPFDNHVFNNLKEFIMKELSIYKKYFDIFIHIPNVQSVYFNELSNRVEAFINNYDCFSDLWDSLNDEITTFRDFFLNYGKEIVNYQDIAHFEVNCSFIKFILAEFFRYRIKEQRKNDPHYEIKFVNQDFDLHNKIKILVKDLKIDASEVNNCLLSNNYEDTNNLIVLRIQHFIKLCSSLRFIVPLVLIKPKNRS